MKIYDNINPKNRKIFFKICIADFYPPQNVSDRPFNIEKKKCGSENTFRTFIVKTIIN